MNAEQAHLFRLNSIRTAKRFVLVVAFTFDLEDVTQALIEAKRRESGLDVRVLIDRDQSLSGPTANLRPRVLQLTSRAIPVRLYSRCRLHAKVLLSDAGQLWGSLNWTNASLRNIERNAATQLSQDLLDVERRWFDDLWAVAKDFAGRESADQMITPTKSSHQQQRHEQTPAVHRFSGEGGM